MRRRVSALAAAVLCTLLAGLSACRPEGAHEAYPREDHAAESATHRDAGPEAEGDAHGEEAEHEGDSSHGAAPGSVDAFAVAGVLRSIPSAEAVDTEGPGERPFRVALRTPYVGHYPCTGCHIRPIGHKDEALAQMHGPRPEHEGAASVVCSRCHDPNLPQGYVLDCARCHEREGVRELMPSRTAHPSVSLSHPSGEYRNCLTCHAPENPGTLVIRDGSRASLDEAYRLCRGCHFMQGEDWANGAHGKRLAGWAGERTILSCTGCHDPHDPRFPTRRPVTFPKIARPGESR